MARISLVMLVLVLVATGCGSGNDGAPPTLPRPVFHDDGVIPVDDFNAYLDGIEERWETDAVAVARRFAHPVRQEGGQVSARPVPSTREGTVVVVDATGIGDDSIAAQRVAVDMMQADDLTFDLTRASWTQRCWPGRGHQDFSTKPCV